MHHCTGSPEDGSLLIRGSVPSFHNLHHRRGQRRHSSYQAPSNHKVGLGLITPRARGALPTASGPDLPLLTPRTSHLPNSICSRRLLSSQVEALGEFNIFLSNKHLLSLQSLLDLVLELHKAWLLDPFVVRSANIMYSMHIGGVYLLCHGETQAYALSTCGVWRS